MRVLLALAAIPLALSAPPHAHLPELSVPQWTSIQASFVDGVRGLADWSFSKAADVVEELENALEEKVQDDSELTIWQQLKQDEHSFSRLVKIIEVSLGILA